MSKVKIQGNASGTGVVTLTAPNTNTDRTITLPDGDISLGVGIDDNATSTAITIGADETVGIGVTPKTWDDLTAVQAGRSSAFAGHAASHSTYSLNNAYYNAGWKYMSNSFAGMMNIADGAFNFKVAGSNPADSAISWTTAMSIANDGSFNIGAFSSTGATKGLFYSGTGTDTEIRTSTTSTVNEFHYRFHNPNGEVGGIRTDGTATSYNTSSDYRLKENVLPMVGSIDRLKALKPSTFNFISDATTTVDGFLAHEAQEVVPEAVHGTKDAMKDEEYEVTPAVMDGDTVVTEAVMGTRSVPDYQGIDQSKLVPLLVASLQEAIARIEQLENA